MPRRPWAVQHIHLSSTLRIRIPDWAREFALDLPWTEEKGYALVEVPAGKTEILVGYAVKPVKIAAHPWVSADAGRIAVKRGPVLYCCEKAAEKWEELDPVLSADEPALQPDGTVAVKTVSGETVTLIEYRRWNNRGPLPMRVWFRQDGCASDPRDLVGWEGKLYREWSAVVRNDYISGRT